MKEKLVSYKKRANFLLV